MAGKFELKTAKNGKLHFNLKARTARSFFRARCTRPSRPPRTASRPSRGTPANEDRYERKKSQQGRIAYFVLKAGTASRRDERDVQVETRRWKTASSRSEECRRRSGDGSLTICILASAFR